MSLQKSSLVFKVRRKSPELLAPSSPTPRELKLLSDIDDQQGLHCHVRVVQIFRYHPLMAAIDPVQAIRQAMAKTLVFYYPLAGRLREYCSPNGSKLMVDCTGEGVMFIEAEADVMLEQFGTEFQPPFPCFDELLYNVPGDGIINCPIVLSQVTRLKCGGLIFAMRINHAIVDGIGTAQFLNAIAEIAKGAPKPSIMPVWCRELLSARNPPRVTKMHHEYQQLPLDDKSIFFSKPHHASFFFGPKEIDAMRLLLPRKLAQSASSFEVLTACLWRCRTISLQWQNPDQEVRLLCIVNARFEPCRLTTPLPDGFYGNAFVFPAAVSTAGKLCSRPLEYAVELVKKAKDEANEEYLQSVLDLMAIKGRFCFTRTGSFMVSDLTKSVVNHADHGWGKPLYRGVAEAGLGGIHDGVSFYVPHTNSKGETGRLVPICLPEEAMMRFKKEIDDILKVDEDFHMLISNL